MTWWTRCGLAILTGGLLLGRGMPSRGADEAMPIKDLRLPLERDEAGKIKTQLLAAQARVPPEGEVEAKKVRLEFYKDDAIDALMVTDECRYDRTAGTARSESPVRIEKEGILITGKGFECNVSDQKVKILSNVRVVLDHPKREKEKGK